MTTSTPSELGYRMPPEWAPHQATWISWPHRAATWHGNFAPVPGVMAEAVHVIAGSGEPVRINVVDEAMAADVTARLTALGTPRHLVHLHPFPTDDAWCRDHGAIFVVRGAGASRELAAVRWGFNAWGRKYPAWQKDEQIPRLMARELGVPIFEPGMILEGGSVDVDGAGTLLTTEQCLLNPNRNPGLGKAEIEARLRAFLGVTTIVWLGEGIAGDDTDGHVDDLTRFVAPGVIVTAVEDDPADVNYKALQDNLVRLRAAADAQGKPFTVIPLPMPGPVASPAQRLPASYANFYIGNRVVLMPAYRHPNDERARDILQRLFPTRRVVPLDSWDLVWGLGSFHCLTQQVPAV